MKKEIQENIEEFNILELKLNEIEQQTNLIEKQITELKGLEISLDKLKNFDKKTEMFSMLGSDTFIESEVKNNDKVLVNIGAKIFMKKNIKEAKESIEKRIDKMDGVYKELAEEAGKIIEKLTVIGEEIRANS